MGLSSRQAAATAAAPGFTSLLLGFYAYPRNPTDSYAGVGVALLGGLLLLIALVLVAAAGVLALRRTGQGHRLALVLVAVWLVAGFAAGLTLSEPDRSSRCQEPLALLADVAGGLPTGPLALAAGIAALGLAWLALTASRRVSVTTAASTTAPGLATAGAITAVMAGLLVLGRSAGSFEGNAACAVLSGVVVGSAFALGFLGIGLFVVAIALFVRPAGLGEPLKLWLLTPAAAGLLLIAHLAATSLIGQVQRPTEIYGTVRAELRSTTATQTLPTGRALCLRDHDGYLRVEGNGVMLDLFDDGSVSTLHVVAGGQFKIWTAMRGQVALAAGDGWPSGTATSDGMEQLDAAPGDAEARWRGTVSWDCLGGD